MVTHGPVCQLCEIALATSRKTGRTASWRLRWPASEVMLTLARYATLSKS